MVGDVMQRMGHTVWYNPPTSRYADVVVLQKRFDLNAQIETWRTNETRVIFDVDDWMDNGPVDQVDVVTVDTEAKLALYPGATVIPDCLDLPDNAPVKTKHRENLHRVVWYGSGDNYYHTTNAAEAARRMGLEFVAITDLNNHHYGEEYGITGIQWEIDNVDQHVIDCDLVVCPYVFTGKWSYNWVQSKSANRVLKAWGLGLPVAATPIPSYVDIGVQSFATMVDDWLIAYRGLMDRRAREVDAARGWGIAQQYRAERIAQQWLGVFYPHRVTVQ